jgi:hypothetical protein
LLGLNPCHRYDPKLRMFLRRLFLGRSLLTSAAINSIATLKARTPPGRRVCTASSTGHGQTDLVVRSIHHLLRHQRWRVLGESNQLGLCKGAMLSRLPPAPAPATTQRARAINSSLSKGSVLGVRPSLKGAYLGCDRFVCSLIHFSATLHMHLHGYKHKWQRRTVLLPEEDRTLDRK